MYQVGYTKVYLRTGQVFSSLYIYVCVLFLSYIVDPLFQFVISKNSGPLWKVNKHKIDEFPNLPFIWIVNLLISLFR